MNTNSHYIRERSKIIQIKENLSTQMKNLSPKSEYSLKQNFFDPSKSSPPNEFMIKLQMRMSNYNSVLYTKDDKRDSE
jgi:hypothetical protein